jgi:DNA/RNA-binding domain of Phe-tRNA-synthetase-like protein
MEPMSSTNAPFSLSIDSGLALRAALVWGLGLAGCPKTGAPAPYLEELMGRVRASGESFLPPGRKAAVRDMLRHGKYKPAGRAKPSNEYLLAAALDGSFPAVNGPVDANNAVSLEWGYPASVFDAAKTGPELFLRLGRSGESYVFNPSGQSIELEDLLVVCRRARAGDALGEAGDWIPCGNPVKDAMATKVFEEARDVVAVVYAPLSEGPALLEACAGRFSELLGAECGASSSGFEVIEGNPPRVT